MKNLVFKLLTGVIFLTALLTGCIRSLYYRTQEYNDEFKNSKKQIARMDVRPQESRTDVDYARIIFEREISDNHDITKAYFVISRSPISFRTDQTGFLKIDNDAYEITLDYILSEQKADTEISTSSYIKSDSTGVSSGSSASSDTNLWIDDKFMITLTPEMISKIRMADVLIIRFYFGPIPGTFKIKGYDLNQLKKILN